MAHKSQLENKKYRNWVKAGLGIKYVKDGLEPFCEHLVNQQHRDILSKVKRKHNLSAVSCGLCDTHTLQPDHVRTKSRQCPLGQKHCNCQNPGGTLPCPNNVCGAIYDEIIQLHAYTPPAPYWRNTDAQQWCTEPWSVAKCFINAPGYEQKTKADEFDCPGLLHVLMNNFEFQHHIKCGITGTDAFTRVRNSRNEIFHSHTMELEDSEVNSYIDDMIELLEDEKEIKHRQESKDAVKNLLELKQEDFIISTTDEADIRCVAMAAINEKETELKQTIVDAGTELETKTAEGKQELEGKGLVIKSELEQTGEKLRKELVAKDDEIRTTAAKGKHDIEGKGLIMKSELEQIGKKIRKELVMKDDEIRATVAERKHDIEGKGLIIKEELEQKGVELGNQLTKKEAEAERKLEQKLQESKVHLENKNTLIEEQRAENKQDEDNRKKAEFQKKLVKLYTKYASSVPSFPLQPKRKQMGVSEIYVPPLMTINIQDKTSKKWKEVPISMQQIFEDTEMPAKLIYVLGEAGSGKSIFCKILVHFWCIAHSFPECSLDESDMVKEIGRFDFLFYVLLRNCSDCGSIEKMLEKSYHDPALGDILQNESSKCLIVLDGLDEWTPERKHNLQFLTPGLPARELGADYTIITTSRQWKFDALPITDSEVDKKIKLRGIDQSGIKDLTEKTVGMLNDTFRKSKNAEKCKLYLQNRPFSDMSHLPLILQQLIFLWYDDKLRENSKYAIYSSMLALFLEWKALKSSENQKCDMRTQECLIYPPLPDYLCQFDTFQENTRVIQYLSHLAYETLFDKNKETTLTFSRSTLKRFNIPNDVITFCLNVGILTEEENVSLYASIRQQSSYSFFHKSMQEYLAVVYVASQFKEMMHQHDVRKHRPQRDQIKAYSITIYNRVLRKNEHDLTAVCKECVLKYFGSCETVVDILEQSNVFIMLCGFEPRLLTNVSEYIYNVATVDRMVVEERNKVPEQYFSYQKHYKLFKDIQACIFRCIDEVMSSAKNVDTPVYIADLYVSPSTKELVCYDKNINLKNVLSVEVDGNLKMTELDKEAVYLLLERLAECDQLKAMKFRDIFPGIHDDRITKAVTKILVTNESTLETISLLDVNMKIIEILVPKIPEMRQLVSIQIMSTINANFVPEKVSLALKDVLQTTTLQHISLNISCRPDCHYIVDLSKDDKLQYVDLWPSRFSMVNCNTDNLETCKLYVNSGPMMNQLCRTLYKACKLKHLHVDVRYSGIDIKTDTENLIRLLPSLVSLSTIALWGFILDDNIITCPSVMNNLKEIELHHVRMSMTTWCNFIDSLPALPQSVQVKKDDMYIRDDEFTDARQYVRQKEDLFRVTREQTEDFWFTTKKV